jgi:hypothetical protein
MPLPSRPYQSLVLAPPRTATTPPRGRETLPHVAVERRELSAYAALAALAAGGDV